MHGGLKNKGSEIFRVVLELSSIKEEENEGHFQQ